MKRRYQTEQQRAVNEFRQLATEQNPNIQMVWPASGTSSTRNGAPTAGAGRMALRDRRTEGDQSRERGCGRKISANNGWEVTNYSNATGETTCDGCAGNTA